MLFGAQNSHNKQTFVIKTLAEECAMLGAFTLREAERELAGITGRDKVEIDDELVVTLVIGLLEEEPGPLEMGVFGEPERHTGRTTGRDILFSKEGEHLKE